ncbi:MAG: lipid A deacylase LpxR family protein [Gammaproteobacteria bacterium]|nr:lipid A deacylase LpxR family protein [Gammaproteobacteria bacterium]
MVVGCRLGQTRVMRQLPWIVILLVSRVSFGAVLRLPADSSTFTFMFENDLFGNMDEQYTNGIQIGWLSRDIARYEQARQVPPLILRFVSHLPFINLPHRQHNVGLTFGQQIYTPQNTATRELVVNDRPYAGWLYGGLSFISKDEERLDTIELQAGVVGPWSLAEDAQNFVHDVRNLPDAKGWAHQVKNEPGLALIYEHKRRPFGSTNSSGMGYDLITHVGGAVGNVFTYLNGGAEFRFGWNLPADFGTSVIRPGGDTNAPSAVNDPRLNNFEPFGAHFFAAVSGRVVLRDIFLDGNSFASSHSVDKRPLVGDLILGVSLTFHRLKLSYAQDFRTREFTLQRRRHNFGSVSLSWTF